MRQHRRLDGHVVRHEELAIKRHTTLQRHKHGERKAQRAHAADLPVGHMLPQLLQHCLHLHAGVQATHDVVVVVTQRVQVPTHGHTQLRESWLGHPLAVGTVLGLCVLRLLSCLRLLCVTQRV